MSKIIRFSMSFLNYLGTKNWHEGVDKPSLYQRAYKWRISPATSWKLSRMIWFDKN